MLFRLSEFKNQRESYRMGLYMNRDLQDPSKTAFDSLIFLLNGIIGFSKTLGSAVGQDEIAYKCV